MALNATALGDNIATVFERGITEDDITSVKIALDFAAAYKTYASNAEDGTGDSPATVNEQQFDLAFADGFPVADSSEPIARLIADAAAAYWTGAAFQIINPPQGADTEISALVTAIFDPDDLKADLQEIFDAKGEYANYEPQVARQKKAHEIAEVLHEHTKKVVVMCTGKNSSGTLIYLEGNIR